MRHRRHRGGYGPARGSGSSIDPAELFESFKEGISSLFGDKEESPEVKLLQKREGKVRRWKRHRNAYLVVMAGLTMFNLLVGIVTGIWFPFVAIPAIGWGMGFAIHGLGHRSWLKEHEDDLIEAEMKLGLRAPEDDPRLLPEKVGEHEEIDGVSITDARWRRILEKCREAVEHSQEALEEGETDPEVSRQLRGYLDEGLKNLEQLAAGAERIREALTEITKHGLEGLAFEIQQIDKKITETQDESLREVYLANRAMLVARQAKVKALTAERERMLANAEGFLIAAENVRLDIARLGAGDVPSADTLREPTKRLGDEVEVLRKVEAELRQLQ